MAIPLKCLHHSIVIHLMLVVLALAQNERQFIYNGFLGANLDTDGHAYVHLNGLLQMTNSYELQTSHAVYGTPMGFNPNPSFSTTFVVVMSLPGDKLEHYSSGIVFFLSPSSMYIPGAPYCVLGLRMDIIQSVGDEDINSIYAEIDPSFMEDKPGLNKKLLLRSGKPMQVWIDYDGAEMLVHVTLAPLGQPKPSKSNLSGHTNVSSSLLEPMIVGFSSSYGSNYLLGWSWNQSGQAQGFDPAKLPPLPRSGNRRKRLDSAVLLLLIMIVLLLLVVAGAAWLVWRKKFEELYEPWESEYVSDRFSYKDLFAATKGFRNSELLGRGGFGKVYKGVLPSTHVQVAVKRISYESRQGMKEFMAEVVSMRRLRHINIGYCRRKGDLLLVYDYMPNGSLDKFLFSKNVNSRLHWYQRFNIIKGVASALLYLHEEWEQVVLHRDVKASNVLLDANMNARLGDFGLAKLCDHNTNPQTTHVVGTLGYIATEAFRTRKPTIFTDIYAFGMSLIEVSCGRKPIDHKKPDSDIFLVDWVYGCWKRGAILEAADPKLEGSYDSEEMELVLKLGLLCVHPKAEKRPNMRQAARHLGRDSTVPDIPSDFNHESNDFLMEGWGTSSPVPLVSSETVPLGRLSSVIRYYTMAVDFEDAS